MCLLWQMSDGALLPMIVGVITLACCLVAVFTNRRFGHPTFFAPHHEQSKWLVPIPNNSDEKKNISRQQRPPPQPEHTNLPREGPAVAAAERSLGRKNSSSIVFADLPASGVVEYIASFLSPADLVGVAPICVDLSRVSACEALWKAHCVRIFGKVDSVLGEPWREAQHRQQQKCEQSQCRELGGGDEQADVTVRRGRGQLRQRQLLLLRLVQQRLQLRLPNFQFRCNTASIHSSSSIGRNSGSNSISTNNNLDTRARTSNSTRTSSPSSPISRVPSSPHLTCSSYHPSRPQPPPSCSSSVSWKEAFFYAHRKRPRDLLKLARSSSSCVVLVHGRVHDLTDFLPSHPGGSLILREHASTDATGAFERFFHSREARRIARRFVVWDGVEAMGREGTLWKATLL